VYRWKGEGTVMRMKNVLVNSISLSRSLAGTSSFSLTTSYLFNTFFTIRGE
jgi:hypothetical protein